MVRVSNEPNFSGSATVTALESLFRHVEADATNVRTSKTSNNLRIIFFLELRPAQRLIESGDLIGQYL